MKIIKKVKYILLYICCLIICNITCAYAANSNSTISTAESIFYFIKSDNSLWQFEIKEDTIQYEKLLDDVVFVSREYAIKSDSTLWDCATYTNPLKIMDDIKSVSSSYKHTLIIKTDNTLWGLGYNEYGQLGQGDIIKTTDDYFKYEYCEPYFYEEPVKIMNNVSDAKAGGNHSVVLKTDGSMYTFGGGSYGQLGYGNPLRLSNEQRAVMRNVERIEAGSSSSFAFKEDGTVWWCGTLFEEHIDSEELDHYAFENFYDDVRDISVRYRIAFVLKEDDSLWKYVFSGEGKEARKEKILDDVNCISTESINECNVLILKNNGELFFYEYVDGNHILEKISDNVKIPQERVIAPERNFIDISNKSEEEQKAINSLTKAGIINGVSETEFLPDKTMTRAEIAALLLRMTAEEESEGNGGFYDVSSDDWYCGVASKSAELGIVKGFEDNTFRGEDTISKLQFVSLVSRTLEKERGWEYKTNDNLSVPDWAKEDISLAISEGIISENENLDGDITRSEAAVILYKLYDLI